MPRIICKRYENCKSPLCPLDQISIEQGIWYPDEEMCKATEFKDLQWIKTQKKIAKKTKDFNTFYTVEMLNRNIIVTSAIKGLDPDKDYKTELKKWLKAHPNHKKKEISEELKKRLRDALKRGRETMKKEKK